MWKPAPSAISAMPIISRKASASIRVVGWRSMKPATGPDATYMTRDGDDDRRDHHADMLGHADRGDDRIDREDQVDERDLRDDRAETCASTLLAGSPSSAALDVAVDLRVALTSRNRPPANSTRSRQEKSVAEDGEERRRQADQPEQRQQEDDAEDERHGEADLARALRLLRRQLADDHRDEDDVVDAEHDLHGGERDKARPDGRIGDPVEDVSIRVSELVLAIALRASPGGPRRSRQIETRRRGSATDHRTRLQIRRRARRSQATAQASGHRQRQRPQPLDPDRMDELDRREGRAPRSTSDDARASRTSGGR